MSDNYIMVNGVKLELTPEQVAALTAKLTGEDLFERGMGKRYFYISGEGDVCSYVDCSYDPDNKRYNIANYCRNKEKMEQRALHETLDRLLWRYSEQHGGDPEWDGDNEHWNIFMGPDNQFWYDLWSSDKHSGPYFCSEKVAKAAIREVVEPFCKAHPEFVW